MVAFHHTARTALALAQTVVVSLSLAIPLGIIQPGDAKSLEQLEHRTHSLGMEGLGASAGGLEGAWETLAATPAEDWLIPGVLLGQHAPFLNIAPFTSPSLSDDALVTESRIELATELPTELPPAKPTEASSPPANASSAISAEATVANGSVKKFQRHRSQHRRALPQYLSAQYLSTKKPSEPSIAEKTPLKPATAAVLPVSPADGVAMLAQSDFAPTSTAEEAHSATKPSGKAQPTNKPEPTNAAEASTVKPAEIFRAEAAPSRVVPRSKAKPAAKAALRLAKAPAPGAGHVFRPAKILTELAESSTTSGGNAFLGTTASAPYFQTLGPQAPNWGARSPLSIAAANGYSRRGDFSISSGASVNHLDLTLGKATILQLPRPAARVAISNPEVASAVVLGPNQIQLVGNGVGVANLLVWYDSYSAQYASIDLSVQRDVSTLARQLQQIDAGIHILPMAADDSIILTGEAESIESAQLAVELAKAFFNRQGSAGASSNASSTQKVFSQMPGSAIPGSGGNVINLIRIKGMPSTKLELVREKLKEVDANIVLDVVPGQDGVEKAILTGRVQKAGTVSKAINLTSIFYGKPGLQLLTGPGGNALRSTAGSNDFQSNTAFSNNMDVNILQGSVVTDASGNVISMLQVVEKPQIRASVKFLDISRTALEQLGNSFMTSRRDLTIGSFSGGRSPAPGANIASFVSQNTGQAVSAGAENVTTSMSRTFADGVTQIISIDRRFSAAISALQEKRKVRSLAEPTLMMLSGEKASFLAGGEIPIPVIGGNGQISIDYRQFGIRLNLIATVTDDGKIHMVVAPEVSSLDPANSVATAAATVPAIKTRRLQTTLELQPGQSFVLAGLYNQEETNSVSRFPGLGNVPILGSFFRNKWNNRADNELVVIIEPEIIYPETDGGSIDRSRAVGQSTSMAPTGGVQATKAVPSGGGQETSTSTDIINRP
ncbi:MAG: pilus assembly protein N-terminal domain-containing protein [Candidatus Melainabacteria bacterium]|nr:pilus assembly protein N-terminal domain-containing protein [Candidatus Melainabacteria bacterium]